MRRYDLDDLNNRSEVAIGRAAAFIGRTVRRWHRAEVRNVERLPAGAALLVGNHGPTYWTPDTLLLLEAIYRARGVVDVPYGLAHEVVLKTPGVNHLLCPLGAVRASHRNAERILAAGFKAVVYPGGDVDAARTWRDRNEIRFGGRCGYIRLALRAGVPIVPVVNHGAHSAQFILTEGRGLAKVLGLSRVRLEVCPVSLSMPWGLTVGPWPYVPFPSKITVDVLPSIDLGGSPEAADDPQFVRACADRVEAALQQALTRLAAESP